MVKHLKHLYEFGSFVLDPDERLLQHDGKPVSLTPKVFDLLLVLIENKGHLLEKEDLMRALWQDSFVEEGNLSFNISTLRKALGENPKERQYIETVPKRGYRFVANVRIVEQEVDEQQIISREAAAQTVASRKEAEESFNETEKDRIEKSDFTNLPLDVKIMANSLMKLLKR
jgi:DNA-binding winged helix-turn-helix (wHTH) protein